MHKRLVAIILIFCGASIAWLILGQTLVARTDYSDAKQQEQLSGQWGSPQIQDAPQVRASFVDSANRGEPRFESL